MGELTARAKQLSKDFMEHDCFSPHETPQTEPKRRIPPPGTVNYRDDRLFRERKNKSARGAATGPEFIGICGKHGETLFETETGACLSCLFGLSGSGLPPLVVYRAAGATQYPAPCETHGPAALHLTQNGLCVDCFAEQRGDPVRVRARREGRKTYDAHCDACGETTEHHVSSGTCAVCTNSVGAPRKAEARSSNRARIAARAAGLTTYQDSCPTHGEHAHHTARGKCLGCFTTLGQPRKR